MVDPKNPPSSSRNLPPAVAPQSTVAAFARSSPARARRSANFSSLPFWFGVLLFDRLGWCGCVHCCRCGSDPQAASAAWRSPIGRLAFRRLLRRLPSDLDGDGLFAARRRRAIDCRALAPAIDDDHRGIRCGRSPYPPFQSGRTRATGTAAQGAQNVEPGRFRRDHGPRAPASKAISNASNKGSIHQVKEIQTIVRENMSHIEQMMEDKFTMMRVLDERLAGLIAAT